MIDEEEFEAGALQQFLRAWRNWRKESPEKTEVLVYVGNPDSALKNVAEMLGKPYEEWQQKREKAAVANAVREVARDLLADFKPQRSLDGKVVCDCPKCTAARTEREGKHYDA